MPKVHVVDIDPRLPLREQPETGHNRWHEAIPPILEVDPGDTVIYGTRSGLDGQVQPGSASGDVAGFDRTRVHPLTGPVAVRGAMPGDVVAVDILAIEPDPWEHRGFTLCTPRIGFLGEEVDDTLVHWQLHGPYAESPQLPGIRIPAAPFPGTLGVALSTEVRERATAREAPFYGPEPAGAVPTDETIASQGLRTLPPRENGGNVDAKLAGPGATMLLPVLVEGARVSVGDVHFAQGDGEVCGTAIEMCSRTHLRFRLIRGGSQSPAGTTVRIERPAHVGIRPGADAAFHATTGIAAGERPGEPSDALALAARRALEAMMEYICDRGFDRMQAYVICSVAVDLRITQLVNAPTVGVTAVLPLSIFA